MYLTSEKKKEFSKHMVNQNKHRRFRKPDSLFTYRINHLTEHLKDQQKVFPHSALLKTCR